MAVPNFKCQLAKAQIERLLAGDPLPEETVTALREHMAECDGCRDAVRQRQMALQQKLGMESPEPKGMPPLAVRPQVDGAPAVPVWRSHGRTLAFSVGLAAVLVAMSFVARDPRHLFGPKASVAPMATVNPPAPAPQVKVETVRAAMPTTPPPAANPPAPAPTQPVPPAATPPKPAATQPAPTVPATPAPAPVAATPAKPAPVSPAKPARVSSARRRQTTVRRRPAPVRPRAVAPSPGVRVYDENGRPL